MILDGKRVDGRGYDQVRPISCEVGVLPRTHGSALFTRGETQALVYLLAPTASPDVVEFRFAPVRGAGGERPPADLEAERAVLGAVLLDPGALLQVLETLREEEFYL